MPKRSNLVYAATALLSIFCLPSQAALVSADFSGQVSGPDGNACAGYFGDTFDSCTIFINENGVRIELSPVIAKFDADLTVDETNGTEYPSVNGSEWSFLNTTTDNKTGDWEYTPTGDDPGVKYWASKAGNAFKLFWDVTTPAVGCMGDDYGNYNLTCLSLANVVDSGSWDTPSDKELSNLTFYNSELPTVVPVPAAVWLFGTALIGFIGMSRRTRV